MSDYIPIPCGGGGEKLERPQNTRIRCVGYGTSIETRSKVDKSFILHKSKTNFSWKKSKTIAAILKVQDLVFIIIYSAKALHDQTQYLQ